MTLEELQTQIAEILPPGFQPQYGTGYRNTYSLKIDGKYFCYEESPETILDAILNPEEWQAEQDADIEALLEDLTATVKGD